MRFAKHGKTYQLVIASSEDLESVLNLDESLWMATAAPVSNYRCDATFLAAVDADANGRITSDELKGAIRWLLARLNDRSRLGDGISELPLCAVDSDCPEGKAVVDSANYILKKLGVESTETISLAQVREFLGTVQSRPLNGDGIIVPESATKDDVAAFIRDAVTCTGGTPDTSGRTGVSEQQIKDFLAAIPAFLSWRERGALAEGESSNAVMPFGSDTPAMYETMKLNGERIDLYFRLCSLLQFDPRTSSRVAGSETALAKLNETTGEAVSSYLTSLPIAPPDADGQLPLQEEKINPLYRAWIGNLKRTVLGPILGTVPETLDEAAWTRVRNALAPYAAYLADRKGEIVQGLAVETLQTYTDPTYAAATTRLIEADRRVAGILQNAHDVERLLLYHHHLLRLTNNFVSFPQLYEENDRALFEVGSLVMDGRWFNLAVKVDDVAGHSAVAKQSNLFVMYLEITGVTGEKFSVAVPVTSGTKGNLAVGKRGVFFDTGKKEFDARVTQVIENPVSLREALAMPFIRLWRLAEGKIESWSGAAEKQLQSEFNKTLAATTAEAPQQPVPAPAPAGSGRANMFMGIGVATAALGSSFAFVTKTFAAMDPSHVAYGFLGAALMVMFPISLIAYLKLRRQDLSSLLEGAGWAVNARMRLNRPQRRSFTRQMPFPEGAEGTPRRRWLRNTLIAVLVVLLAAALYRHCHPADTAVELSPAPLPEAAAPASQK